MSKPTILNPLNVSDDDWLNWGQVNAVYKRLFQYITKIRLYTGPLTSNLTGRQLLRPLATKEKTKDLIFMYGTNWNIQVGEKLYPYVKNYSQICDLISCYNRHSRKLTVEHQTASRQTDPTFNRQP